MPLELPSKSEMVRGPGNRVSPAWRRFFEQLAGVPAELIAAGKATMIVACVPRGSNEGDWLGFLAGNDLEIVR